MKIYFFILCAGISFQSLAAPSLIIPKTEVSYWNHGSIQANNNCYNYATNRRSDSYAQPGQASYAMFHNLNCDEVFKAASADLGLTPTQPFAFGESDETLIALVVAPDYDFHWYRRDNTNLWTHKMGGERASSFDNDGKEISSPETAARGPYTEFCGYFRIKNYAYSAHQQNGGYVRVGTMKNLPSLPENTAQENVLENKSVPSEDVFSDVELLMYSGRPNPRASLRDLLADARMSEKLHAFSHHLNSLVLASSAHAQKVRELPTILGDNGIVIHDKEGLVFPKGSTVYLRAQKIMIEDEQNRRFAFALNAVNQDGLVQALRKFILNTP